MFTFLLDGRRNIFPLFYSGVSILDSAGMDYSNVYHGKSCVLYIWNFHDEPFSLSDVKFVQTGSNARVIAV